MRNKKIFKYAIIGAIIAAPIAAFSVSKLTEAAIPVIDAANIEQQALTYAETIKTVMNTAQQISLQLKELQSLSSNTMNDFKSSLDTDFKKITSIFDSSTGVLNPTKDTQTAWNESFGQTSLTKDTATYMSVASANNGYSKVLDQSNYDSLKIIKDCSVQMDQTNARIQELLELNASAEGQKQAAQIQNMLLAEQAKLLYLQNVIKSAETSSRITYYQKDNRIDQNSAAIAEKATENLKNYPNPSVTL